MRILLVDSTNNFLRNYAVKPDLSSNGESIGGLVGSLHSIGSMAYKLKPDRLILVWDGKGGSVKRKSILKDYKNGRKPARLNRNYEFQLEGTERNKIKQRLMLAEYLKLLPLQQIIIDNIEADDAIAYLINYFAGDDKIIASNDKDFYQLINDKVKVYALTKKVLMDTNSVVSQYSIYPRNFALARSFVGDPSDGLKGVSGIGFKRLLNYLPMFGEEKKISLENIFEFCEEKKEKKYKRILEQKDIVIRNYKLMQLETPIIGNVSVQKIKNCLDEKITFNPTAFRLKLLKDGIGTIGDNFFNAFRLLYVRGKEA